jgi:GH15 family glucan-1,4-alpha-glucosidase
MYNLNYGIIGNCMSAALISEKGNIDWLCLPHFDSPAVFSKNWIKTKEDVLPFRFQKNIMSGKSI